MADPHDPAREERAAPGVRGAVAAYRELTGLGFPARYPLAQFPNPPLLLAIAASVVGLFARGSFADHVTAVGIVGIAVWAWQELASGVNLFRRALGLVVLVTTVTGLVERMG